MPSPQRAAPTAAIPTRGSISSLLRPVKGTGINLRTPHHKHIGTHHTCRPNLTKREKSLYCASDNTPLCLELLNRRPYKHQTDYRLRLYTWGKEPLNFMNTAGARPVGGRVLGSAASARRSLSPAISSVVGNGRLSPSASSVSLNSEFSLRDGENEGGSMVCPICSEGMVCFSTTSQHIYICDHFTD